MNAVMPMHSIIITKDFQNQYGTLTESQLLALFTIMKSLAAGPVYEKDGKTRTGYSRNVGFYNCGQTSGCSQAHRHMQLLPLEGEDGLGDFPIERGARAYKKGESLPDETFSVPSLPYMHFVRRLSGLDEKASNEADLSAYLKKVYSELLDVMQCTMRDHPDCKTTELDKEEGMHYNLLLTHEHMHVIPRREESYTIPPREGTSEKEGKPAATEPKELSVNSIGYMGTMLVESETDDRRLREVGGVSRKGVRVCRGVGRKLPGRMLTLSCHFPGPSCAGALRFLKEQNDRAQVDPIAAGSVPQLPCSACVVVHIRSLTVRSSAVSSARRISAMKIHACRVLSFFRRWRWRWLVVEDSVEAQREGRLPFLLQTTYEAIRHHRGH